MIRPHPGSVTTAPVWRLCLLTSTVLSGVFVHAKIYNWFSCSLEQQGHGYSHVKIGDWSPSRCYVLASFSGTLVHTACSNLAQPQRHLHAALCRDTGMLGALEQQLPPLQGAQRKRLGVLHLLCNDEDAQQQFMLNP